MTKNISRYYWIVTLIFMPQPTVVPGAPDGTPENGSAISAIGTPVHDVVPGASSHDTSAEVLARAITDLFDHPDVVWSTSREMACQGKANFLRLGSDWVIWLDVIKPGIRFMTGVNLWQQVWNDGVIAIKEYLRKDGSWKQNKPEWFLPEWLSQRPEEEIAFDSDGATRPGAVYVFERTMVLEKWWDGKPGIQLRWIGRHTNPTERQRSFSVNDTLTLEEV